MVKYLLIILIGILPFSIVAQISFSTTTCEKSSRLSTEKVYSNHEYYDYPALISINEEETIITMINMTAKSIYFIDRVEKVKDEEHYFYFTNASLGGHVLFIFNIDDRKIELVYKEIENEVVTITKFVLDIQKAF